MTTTQAIKAGDYFHCSWGYDQTNYDYLVVTRTSPTGKTAMVRMVEPICVGQSGQCDLLTPGVAFGPEFRMKVDGDRLRGSYPFCSRPDRPCSSTRLGTFWPTQIGDIAHQTDSMFGH